MTIKILKIALRCNLLLETKNDIYSDIPVNIQEDIRM